MRRFPALDLVASQPDDDAIEDLVYATLDDFAPIAIDAADNGGAWRVYFADRDRREQAFDALARAFEGRLRISSVDVPDEDWARRSQAHLTAIRVGRIVVAPPWDAVPSAEIAIVIEPSTGFGTGHHETTRLCLAMLQTIDVHDRSVIDVGTGSGVLAIAAARLGARRVIAADHDPDALRNARENLERNPGAHVDLVEADLRALDLPAADIVLANLTAGVLQRYAREVLRLLNDEGLLIVSGFSPAERDDVVAALSPLAARGEQSEGPWTATVLQR